MPADTLFLREDIASSVGNQDPFIFFQNLDGEVYRELEFRKTLCAQIGGKQYFVKFHRGSSFGEILKNIFQLRLPVISARNEWQAITRLQDLGIEVPRVAAFGLRGALPHKRESFIVTDDLGTQENLEDLTRSWADQRPDFSEKLELIREVAKISATMHGNGICHRDFYLCHFMVTGEKTENKHLTLYDLHRALVKPVLGERWKIKDIGSLYFSAMDIGLSQKDLFRFMRIYSGVPLKTLLQENTGFWKSVDKRAMKLRRKNSASTVSESG